MPANIILSRSIILLLTLLCNWNGSMIFEDSASKDSSISFSGELIDHSGANRRTLKNILIGGKYEAIPFYQTVSKKDQTGEKQIDPKQNKVLIDLREIESIELKYPESPTKSEIALNGRNYVEIIITSTNNNKKNYLIESSRKLTFEENDTSLPSTLETNRSSDQSFSGELTFLHVKKLVFTGSKFQNKDINNKTEDKKSLEKDADDLLNQIEKNVQNLPKNDPSLLLNIKETLLSLLKSLRAQLQKLVDMIH